MKKRIIVSVINDLVTDQRVLKECKTLHEMGFEILLLGRWSNQNFELSGRPYKIKRFKNLFKQGAAMYLLFNLQIFFYILFSKADILWANDLDTLLPNYFISKIKKIKLVYDSHEYFTMTVIKRSSRKIWNSLEEYLFPKLKNVITVSEHIKNIYEKKYGITVTVIRNVPLRTKEINTYQNWNDNKKMLVMQGAGINEHQGGEEAVLMMKYLPDRFILYFIGGGTVMSKLNKLTIEEGLSNKINFIDRIPYNEMMSYTKKAFIGLILLDVNITDQNKFALPNRFFDYIKAGVPVLSTEALEIRAIVEKFKIGQIINDTDPKFLAQIILEIENNEEGYHEWKFNTKAASKVLCWENEELILKKFIENLS